MLYLFANFSAEPKVDIDAKLKGVQKVKGGLTLTLHANITGTPIPTITWYHEDKPIEKTAQTSIETSASRTSLTVKNASGLNSGKYKVVAENSAGSDSGQFEVLVTGKYLCTSDINRFCKDLNLTSMHQSSEKRTPPT